MSGFVLLAGDGANTLSEDQKTRCRSALARRRSDRVHEADAPGFWGLSVNHAYLGTDKNNWDGETETVLSIGDFWRSSTARGIDKAADIAGEFRDLQDETGVFLEGNFAVAYYDHRKRNLVVERDIFSIYPLYYARTDDLLLISNELKLFPHFGFRTPDKYAVLQFMKFASIPTDRTLLQDVKRLTPCTRLSCLDGKLTLRPTYRPTFERSILPGPEEYAQMSHHFEGYLDRFKSTYPACSVTLSGGLDSRISLAAAHNIDMNMNPLCIGGEASRERRVAAQVAEAIGVDIASVISTGRNYHAWAERAFWISDATASPKETHYLDAFMNGRYFDSPMIHGIFGTEIAGGQYHQPRLVNATGEAIREACFHMTKMVAWPAGLAEQLIVPDLHGPLSTIKQDVVEHLFGRIGFASTYDDFLWYLYNMIYYGHVATTICGQITPWANIVTPYMDKPFFEFCNRLDLGADRKAQVEWGSVQYPWITQIPRVKDGALLPVAGYEAGTYTAQVKKLHRKNQIRTLLTRLSGGRINPDMSESFIHYDVWFRRWPKMREMFRDRLFAPHSLDLGIWRREGLEILFDNVRRGRSGWGVLGPILAAETCLRYLVNGETPADPWIPEPELQHSFPQGKS